MKKKIGNLGVTLLLVLATAVASTVAFGQVYPSKPIRIIVPYPPGGTSDILARALGPGLTAALGQPVIVENKPGSTGNVGADLVAKSPADGYTLLLADIGSLAISPSIFPTLPFDPVKDFAPVIMVAYSPHLLAVQSRVPAKDVKELIALAKAKPGSLNFAVSGIGGANHLAGVDFAHAHAASSGPTSRTRAARRPSPTWSAARRDVLFNGMLATYPMVKGGKLRGARDLQRASASRRRPTSRPSPNPGCPASRPARSRASSRRPARRRKSSTSCTQTITEDPRHAGDAGAPRPAPAPRRVRDSRASSAPSSATRRRAGPRW